jgi:AraC family transcriptional activator FtrA
LAVTTIGVKIMPNSVSLSGPSVAVLVYDGLCTFEFGIAYEIFGLSRPEMGAGWYRFSVCGVEPGPLRAAGGLTVSVDGGLEGLEAADLIVVPGWRAIDAIVPDALVRALQAAHRTRHADHVALLGRGGACGVRLAERPAGDDALAVCRIYCRALSRHQR